MHKTTKNLLQGSRYLWQLPTPQHEGDFDIASTYNISIPIAQVLANRGLFSKEQLDAYLFSSFEKDVAHPSKLKDAEKAVARIIHAINTKEKILIVGDYDVDGITSSAMMMLCLKPLGAEVNFFLPNRARDGYGLSTKIVNRAAQNFYTLMITVDNGITAFEPARKAKEWGIDLIITDHHRPHDHVPEAYAIINPHQHDCSYPFKHFAGVGVIFKVLSLLYEKVGKELPVKAYELLLLGTVADVVPLTHENRFWVRHCLRYVNEHDSISLTTLKTNGKVTKPELSSLDIGFSIAPQINALGRLEDPRDGVKFLIGSDEHEVATVGQTLLKLNMARREIEQTILKDVEKTIAEGSIDIATEKVLIAASESWPAGVIGLVASRLMNTYSRPTILLHLTPEGIAKGSCRSIPEFNIFDALSSCKDLLTTFGGHACAAGLSLPIENLPELKKRLEQLATEKLTPADLVPKLYVDAQATLADFNKKLIGDLQHLEPFGNQNAQPSFFIKHVTLLQEPTLLKGAHVKCLLFSEGTVKPIIFFNRPELYQEFLERLEEPFTVAAHATENHWNGSVNIELLGIDVTWQTDATV